MVCGHGTFAYKRTVDACFRGEQEWGDNRGADCAFYE